MTRDLKHYEPIAAEWGDILAVEEAPLGWEPSLHLELSREDEGHIRTMCLTLEQAQQLVATLSEAIVNHPHFLPKDRPR